MIARRFADRLLCAATASAMAAKAQFEPPQRKKVTSALQGYKAETNWRPALLALYSEMFDRLDKLPDCPFKRRTYHFYQRMTKIVWENNDWAKVEMIAQVGPVEFLLDWTRQELELVQKYGEWRAWERPDLPTMIEEELEMTRGLGGELGTSDSEWNRIYYELTRDLDHNVHPDIQVWNALRAQNSKLMGPSRKWMSSRNLHEWNAILEEMRSDQTIEQQQKLLTELEVESQLFMAVELAQQKYPRMHLLEAVIQSAPPAEAVVKAIDQHPFLSDQLQRVPVDFKHLNISQVDKKFMEGMRKDPRLVALADLSEYSVKVQQFKGVLASDEKIADTVLPPTNKRAAALEELLFEGESEEAPKVTPQ
eukprot:TRINITY_DN67025_c3_g1_i1.p2 TRINITY_DN67025_c3_g1~~TRINITY_DN67025_c3_g1_i1.p2  ORF type:complete len:372 (+),score=43.38 TRINITY_DN67025_c3_g1_i1:22-1116(+)